MVELSEETRLAGIDEKLAQNERDHVEDRRQNQEQHDGIKVEVRSVRTEVKEDISALEVTVLSKMKELTDAFYDFKRDAPKKFASKLSEKIVYGMVTLILVTVLGSILASVIIGAS